LFGRVTLISTSKTGPIAPAEEPGENAGTVVDDVPTPWPEESEFSPVEPHWISVSAINNTGMKPYIPNCLLWFFIVFSML
jgi:hypothetical protein